MSTIKMGMTKWLETGELCEVIFTQTNDLREFAAEWDMPLEGDEIPKSDYKHAVPVVICDLSVENEEHHRLADAFDGLLTLSDATDGTICRLLEKLCFEAFKAGAKWQAEKKVKPIAIVP